MNKIKREFDKLFYEKSRFSETIENRVVTAVMNRNQKSSNLRSWQYLMVVCGFVAIIVLLIGVGLWQPHTSKDEALAAWMEEQNDAEVIFEEMDVFHKDDAVVVYKEQQNERLLVHVAYLTYKERQWIQTDQCTNGFNAEDEDVHYLNSTQEPYIYCGAEKTDLLKQVIIGQEQAKMLKVENEGLFWFAFAASDAERVVFEYADGTMQRMNSIEWDYAGFDDTVPIVGSLSEPQYELSYKADTMNRGNDEYQAYPVVIEPKVDDLRGGDVVYIEVEDGEQKLTRIVGLPDEKVAIRNGTVVVNTIPLDIFFGFATQEGFNVYEEFIEKFKQNGENFNKDTIHDNFFLNMDEVQLNESEYFIVADNWSSGLIGKINKEQILGKVLGYDASDMVDEWSQTERALYEEFRLQNDAELFRGVDPMTVARIQLYAQFLADERTVYHLYTTRAQHQQWSEVQHMREYMQLEAERQRHRAFEMAQALSQGTFKEMPEEKGVILFTLNGIEHSFQMVKNEQGIWQVAFMPIQ
ncbi:S26 family signal peptidase [Lysinibacillus sp. NPDC097287]|uniref:S26 family signal peptidase n=1 Tax=Lysinibacillus sp. NPDC097287 TaxID=3364144 RepID=UPI003819D8F3